MALACALLAGVQAIAPSLVAAAVTVLATHQMAVARAITAGLVQNATLSYSAKTRLALVTVSAHTVDACVAQDIAVNRVKQVSGAAMACAESMELAILGHISACVVVVGLDRGVTSKKVRA